MKHISSFILAICASISLCSCGTTNSHTTNMQTETTNITEPVTTTVTTTAEVVTTTVITTEERKTPSLKNKYNEDSLNLTAITNINDILQSLDPEKYREANVIGDEYIEQGDVRVIYLWDDPHCKEKDPSTLTLAECTQDIVELYINASDNYVAFDGVDTSTSSNDMIIVNALPPNSVNCKLTTCTAIGNIDANQFATNERHAYTLMSQNYDEKIANATLSFDDYKLKLHNTIESAYRYRVKFDDFWSATFNFYHVEENVSPFTVNFLYFDDSNHLVSADSGTISDENKVNHFYNVPAASGYGLASKVLVLADCGI